MNDLNGPVRARRKAISKRLRFSVFNRDNFTCQYCGAQPPDVVLVADHITPIAKGGTDEIDNLITSCEPCNQGKTDRLLGSAPGRIDAEKRYLETQQEIIELRRYQSASRERDALTAEITGDLQGRWCELSGEDWHPTGASIYDLINRYGASITDEAMRITALKIRDGIVRTYGDRWLRYLNGVARNLAAGAEDE